MSIEGWAGCEVGALAPAGAPTPLEGAGVTTELPPVMPVLPAPTVAPAEPGVWARATGTAEATHARAATRVLIMVDVSEDCAGSTPGAAEGYIVGTAARHAPEG